MDLEKIERLLEIVAKSGMAEVEVEEEGFRMVVRASAPAGAAPPMMPVPVFGGYPAGPAVPAAVPSAPSATPAGAEAPAGEAAPAAAPAAGVAKDASEVVVQAPIVGTFYRAPSPDSPPFVEVGATVNPGDVLCIIEAMKLMNEIQSEHAGTVRRVLVENAQPVEFDQPLFVIEKA
jgi:acetyl-CoA carboxylase biotin carboxyl carrier protein